MTTSSHPHPPLVDVLVPAYRARHLREAVESVRAQTVDDWRLTISDDSPAGDDRVREVVSSLPGDPRICLVATTGGMGEMPNTNRLIRATRGRYVVILHDDDRLHPTFLERRLEFMRAHPECSYCMSGCVVIDDDGQKKWDWIKRVPPGILPSEAFAALSMKTEGVVGPPVTVFARREAYEAAGEFVPKLPHSDHEMFLRLGLVGPVGYLPGADADYRIHAESRSRVFRFPIREVVSFPDRVLELIHRRFPHALEGENLRRIRATWLLREIVFDYRRPGGRWYETRLFMRALVLDPRAVFDARTVYWLKKLAGSGTRRNARRALAALRVSGRA